MIDHWTRTNFSILKIFEILYKGQKNSNRHKDVCFYFILLSSLCFNKNIFNSFCYHVTLSLNLKASQIRYDHLSGFSYSGLCSGE